MKKLCCIALSAVILANVTQAIPSRNTKVIQLHCQIENLREIARYV